MMGSLKFFSNLNLGLKLNLIVILVLGGLLVTTVVVIGQSASNLTLQTGQQRVEQEVAVIQNRFVEVERELFKSARLLAATSGLIEAVADQDVERIRTLSLVGAAPLDLDDVDIVDAEGNRLVVLTGTADEFDARQEDSLISLALLGIDADGTIVEEESNGEWELRLAVAIPLRDIQGIIVGVLFVSRIVDDELASALNFDRTDVELILVSESDLLAQSSLEPVQQPSTLAEASYLDPAAIRRSLNEETVIAANLIIKENTPHALAYAPLKVGGETQVVIATLINLSDAANFQNRLVRTLSILVAALTVGVVGLIALFARQTIGKPLRALQQVAQRIASGDYSERVVIYSQDEVGELALQVNKMAEAILTREDTLIDLTQNLERQSQGLAINAEISRYLSTILDQTQLLAEVVNQIQTTFKYYHAHIYLLDEKREYLVMAEGTGSAGAEMKAKGHRIALNTPTSLVARTARSREVVSVANVREAPDWLPNDLLPDTYAEMAVPITLDGRVVGVLDVQEDTVAGLDESDANLLRSLADQVAVAIRNAQLFAEVETALADAHAAQARYLSQSWASVRPLERDLEHLAMASTAPAPSMEKTQLMAEARQMVLAQPEPAIVSPNQDGENVLIAPVKLQGNLIGALQMHRQENGQPWHEDDLMVIEAILDQFGQAAENIRLSNSNLKQATRERAIRQITEKMRMATSLEALVEVAANELGEQLGAGHAIVELGTEIEKDTVLNGDIS